MQAAKIQMLKCN